MPPVRLDVDPGQIVMHTEGTICTSTRELVESEAFARVVDLYLTDLEARDSGLLRELGIDPEVPAQRAGLLDLLQVLAHNPLERVARTSPDRDALLARRDALHAFVEGLYDFWRRYDRIMVNHSEAGSDSQRQAPARHVQRDRRDARRPRARPVPRRGRERHRQPTRACTARCRPAARWG